MCSSLSLCVCPSDCRRQTHCIPCDIGDIWRVSYTSSHVPCSQSSVAFYPTYTWQRPRRPMIQNKGKNKIIMGQFASNYHASWGESHRFLLKFLENSIWFYGNSLSLCISRLHGLNWYSLLNLTLLSLRSIRIKLACVPVSHRLSWKLMKIAFGFITNKFSKIFQFRDCMVLQVVKLWPY